MELTVALVRVLVAAAVGFLIGLDRERAESRKARRLFAGVRTFPLIALAGAVPQLFPGPAGVALQVTAFVAVAAVALVSYLYAAGAGDVGATTEMAALVTFLLGALAGSGQLVLAGATGVGVAVLLTAKRRLETFSRTLTAEEVYAVLELAVVAVIVLPVLPDRSYGPWGALNPREIWLVVVLVSALSFAGFVAMRLLGEERGMAVTGALGGLVSSTAVTLAMARRARADDGSAGPAAAAAVLASVVMCGRVGLVAGAVNRTLLPGLAPVLAAMSLVGGLAAWRLAVRRRTGRSPHARLQNPFSLRDALTFGVIYAAVVVVVRGAQLHLGTGGLYAAAALSAVVDVDAATIAFARLGGAATPTTAVTGITIAVVANTLVKLGLAAAVGAGRFRTWVALALGGMAAVGVLAAGALVLVG